MELLEGKMEGARNPETVSTKLEKIADLAGKAPATAFTLLNHFIDMDLLLEAHRRIRKVRTVFAPGEDAAGGIQASRQTRQGSR